MDFSTWGMWVATAIQIAGVWFTMTHPENKSWGWIFFGVSFIILFISSASFLNKKLSPTDVSGIQIWVIGLCFLVAGFAIAKLTTPVQPDITVAKEINTIVRIRFFGDNRLPHAEYMENIATWYAFWNITPVIIKDASQITNPQDIGKTSVVKTWIIFITFDRATQYQQIIPIFDGGTLPPTEWKFLNTRTAILYISGDVPNGVLEIHTK